VATEVYMPQLGLTMTEGTVIKWLKTEGDTVTQGEPVVEIETDKVAAEVEAPAGGVLGPILVSEGSIVPVGGLLSHVLAPGEAPPASAPSAAEALPQAASGALPEPGIEHLPQSVDDNDGRVVASPRARRLAHELAIELEHVEASGPGGRIVEADVRWYADQVGAKSASLVSPVASRLAEELEVDLARLEGTGPGGRIVKADVERAAAGASLLSPSPAVSVEAGTIEPLQGIRRVVAERMTQSFTSTPHFYLSAEVDAMSLTQVREQLLPEVEAATGVRLTVTDILVKVCAQALVEFPEVNAAWIEDASGSGRVQLTDVNVGIATALDEGLIVPAICHADQLTLSEIALRRADLIERARAGKLKLEDLERGTFTLSNLGMFGVDQFHAIINPPQSVILAVGRIRERAVARDGVVVVRPTLYLTLSVDHRLLDGVQGARFLERVAQLLEEPYLLMI